MTEVSLDGRLAARLAELREGLSTGGDNPGDNPGGHCGRRGCRCTHTNGCDHGWVDLPDRKHPRTLLTYPTVAPCPVCRPESWERHAASIERGSVNVR